MDKSERPSLRKGLQLERDMPLQQREWSTQKVAWPVLYLLVVLLMLGAFGDGLMSRTALRSSDGNLQMEYERFVRRGGSTQLRLVLQPTSGLTEVVLSSAYANRIEIRAMMPLPERMISEGDAVRFGFGSRPPSEMRVILHIEPRSAGMLDGWVALAGKPRQAFRQFVYP